MSRPLPGIAFALALTFACWHAFAADAPAANGAERAMPFANLPLRRDGAESGESGGWTAPLLVLSLAGAAGLWAGWRRLARRRLPADAAAGQRIVRLWSQSLTPQASLHAVQWNGEELLIACTSAQVRVVARRAATLPEGREP